MVPSNFHFLWFQVAKRQHRRNSIENDAIIDELLTDLDENEFQFDENDNTFTVNSKSNNENTLADKERKFSKLSQGRRNYNLI